jgi:hypothetical protein
VAARQHVPEVMHLQETAATRQPRQASVTHWCCHQCCQQPEGCDTGAAAGKAGQNWVPGNACLFHTPCCCCCHSHCCCQRHGPHLPRACGSATGPSLSKMHARTPVHAHPHLPRSCDDVRQLLIVHNPAHTWQATTTGCGCLRGSCSRLSIHGGDVWVCSRMQRPSR